MLAKFIIFDICILREHKFLLIHDENSLMKKLEFLLYNNSYEPDHVFVPRRIRINGVLNFRFPTQVSPPPRSYHDFGNTLYSLKEKCVHHRLRRAACTIIVCPLASLFFLLPCVLT